MDTEFLQDLKKARRNDYQQGYWDGMIVACQVTVVFLVGIVLVYFVS